MADPGSSAHIRIIGATSEEGQNPLDADDALVGSAPLVHLRHTG